MKLSKVKLPVSKISLDMKPPFDITGKYRSNGINPNGTEYQCDVVIKTMGDIFGVEWYFDNKLEYSGVGVFANGLFVVSFLSHQAYGVMAYEIIDGKRLEGIWTGADTDGLGIEKLTKIDENLDKK